MRVKDGEQKCNAGWQDLKWLVWNFKSTRTMFLSEAICHFYASVLTWHHFNASSFINGWEYDQDEYREQLLHETWRGNFYEQ